MAASLCLSDLTFASGQRIELSPDSIVLFVGPNNSGKTQSLMDIWGILSAGKASHRLSIKEGTIEKSGTQEQFLDFLNEYSIIRKNSLIAPGINVSPPAAVYEQWSRDCPAYIGPLFAKLIGARDRLSAIAERKRVDGSKEKPAYPLPALDLDPESERKTSKSFYKIFGKNLMLDRWVGSVVNLHVGSRPNTTKHGHEYTPEYASEVRKRPDINSEGDGIKAAAGLLLNVLSIPKNVYLIDEPDVYLHPPQAYAAAKELVRISVGTQLFMATHNAHFVRGLLDASSSRVFLIRLDRRGNEQSVNLIEHEVFEEIESDPLVRFSNLLEAMFFRTAIICENEADCLFYRNLCRAVNNESGQDDNVFWLSSHGKQNIRKFVRILRALGLRVMSLPDLDIINDRSNLCALLESHGGRWSDIDHEYSTLAKLMTERKPTYAAGDVKKRLRDILDGVTQADDELFPRGAADRMRGELKSASPWREIKESGIKALGKGANQLAAQELLSKLEKKGILAPSIGEMESFYPLSSSHGMEWVKEVLELDVEKDASLSEARDFAAKIIAARRR